MGKYDSLSKAELISLAKAKGIKIKEPQKSASLLDNLMTVESPGTLVGPQGAAAYLKPAADAGYIRDLGSILGGFAGGSATGASTLGLGTSIGGVAGGAGGRAVGGQIEDLIKGLAGGYNAPRQGFAEDLKSSASNVASDLKQGAIEELFGQAASGALRSLLPLRPKEIPPGLEDAASEMKRLVQKAESEGVPILSGERDLATSSNMIDSTFSESPITRGVYEKFAGRAYSGLQSLLNRTVSGIKTAGKVTADEIISGVKAGKEKFDKASSELFDKVYSLTENKIVAPTGFIAAVDDVLKNENKTLEPFRMDLLISKMNEALNIVKNRAEDPFSLTYTGDPITFEVLNKTKTRIADLAYGDDVIGTALEGAYKKISKSLNEDLVAKAAELGPEVEKVFADANAFWKKGLATFNSPYVKKAIKLADTEPTLVAETVLKPMRPGAATALKKVLPEETFAKLKTSFLDNVIDKSTEAFEGTNLKGSVGKKLLTTLNGYGESMLKQIFTKEELNALYDVAKISNISQAAKSYVKPGKSTGYASQVITSTLPAAAAGLAGVATGSLAASAGAVLGTFAGLKGLARLATSPQGRKFLADGIEKGGTIDTIIDAASKAGIRLYPNEERE